MAAALTVEQLFDSLAIRLNGPKACSDALTIDWVLPDVDLSYRCTLSHGVLVHFPSTGRDRPSAWVAPVRGGPPEA